MNSNEAVFFIYQLYTRGIRIWAAEEKLMLFIPKDEKLSDTESKILKKNKAEILAICEYNGLTNQTFYRTILRGLEQTIPLSFTQEGLWFLEQYEANFGAYHVPLSFELSKKTSPDSVEKALLYIIQRHAILRSLLSADPDGHGCQRIIHDISPYRPIKRVTVNTLAQCHQLMVKENRRTFDLATELPIRVTLYKVVEIGKTYCHLVIHHVAIDGWSIDCLTDELERLLKAIASHLPLDRALEDLPIQYSDFVLWQRAIAHDSYWKQELAYWLPQLSDCSTLNLPTDRPRPAQLNYQGNIIHFQCSRHISHQLRQLAQNLNVGLYSVLLSAFSLLLGFFSYQNDVVLGVPIANRHTPMLEKLIGCFVNSLVLRIKINIDSSLKAFISQVGQIVLEAQMHQALPFEKLVEALQLEKDTSRHPLFQIMFDLQNFGSQSSGDHQWITPYCSPCQDEVAQFDMTVTWDDSEPDLKGSIRYATALFDQETIENYIQIYQSLLVQFATSADKQDYPLRALEVVIGKAKQHQLKRCNGTAQAKLFDGLTLISSFLKSAAQNAKQTALIDADGHMSYEALRHQAFILAQQLFKVSLNRSYKLVAILSEKGRVQVMAALAIMQAGKAYLPLNIDWPDQRLAEILSSGQVETLLVSPNVAKNKAAFLAQYHIIIVGDTSDNRYSTVEQCLPVVLPTEIAYVMFTSGSTGKPKGVTISHQGAMNTIAAVNQRFKVSARDRVFALSEFSFDLSVYDIFGLLAVGGAVVFPEQSLLKDPFHWLKMVKQYKVSVWNTVPQLAGLLANEVSLKHQLLPHLRLCLLSGDWIPLALPKQLKVLNSNMRVMSLGGATEASIWSAWYQINNIHPAWTSIPYGLAMPNQKMVVMTFTDQLCPVGTIGEIQIGGVGVALNYWGDPLKTAKSFYEHSELGRLYRTGDLGRWHADGYIEFMGRRDTQVKIGGLRIELGDIQSAINDIEDISQSVVIVHSAEVNNTKRIVAYYVAAKPIPSKTLDAWLADRLPMYMTPSLWVHLSELPLTANGKLDRKALGKLQLSKKLSHDKPKTSLEQALCEAYALVLGLSLNSVGIDDDFFALGGDSILSIQLISRLRRSLSIPINVKAIFQFRTVRHIATHFSQQHTVTESSLSESGPLTGPCQLLPIQQWFFNQNFTVIGHWNQAFILRLPKDINKAVLAKSLAALVSYHDAFQLRYQLTNDGYQQSYTMQLPVEGCGFKAVQINFQDQSQLERLKQTLTDWQSHFDLSKGPLYHFGLIEGHPDQLPRLHVACHHLLIDSVSWRLLTDDLKRLYTAYAQSDLSLLLKPESVLGAKGTSYRQWVEVVAAYGGRYPYQQYYWYGLLADFHSDGFQKYRVSTKQSRTFALSIPLTKALLTTCHQAFHTHVDDVLLTAFCLTLKSFTGASIQHILLEGHGRETIKAIDVSHTMGWFTTLYPIRLDCSGDCLETQLEMIKENLRAVPDKGLGYGVLIGYEKQVLPRIRFNYLGQFQQANSSSGEWSITDEYVGQCTNTQNYENVILDVNSMVIDHQLRVQFDAFLPQACLLSFLSQFETQLQQLITWLLKRRSPQWTLSDCKDEVYTLMNLEKAGHQRPLIMFPTGDGGYECYLNTLMPRLSDQYAMLFNNPYLLFQKSQPNYAKTLTIERIAQLSISVIKAIQPTGPYCLFGWSFGGVLALEVAFQLLQRGESVERVVMVDALFDLDDYCISQGEKALESNYLFQGYHPKYNEIHWSGVELLLLKAQQAIEDCNDANYHLFKYYATMTKYNNLNHYLAPDKFQVQLFNSDHLSWITEPKWQQQVVDALRTGSACGSP